MAPLCPSYLNPVLVTYGSAWCECISSPRQWKSSHALCNDFLIIGKSDVVLASCILAKHDKSCAGETLRIRQDLDSADLLYDAAASVAQKPRGLRV